MGIVIRAQQVGAEQIRRHTRYQSLAFQKLDAALELFLRAAKSRRDDIDDITGGE